MSIKEAKEKGRTAFQASKWSEAIQHLTEVLQEDPEDVSSLAIRSSAFQKKGDLDRASKDADDCTKIDPKYVRGYIRKACVLRAFKNYSGEADCYLEGLQHCPGEESLSKGLQMAQRLKEASGENGMETPKTTPTTRKAAFTRLHSRVAATDIHSIVAQSKLDMEMEMLTLQARIAVVAEMALLSQDEKNEFISNLVAENTSFNNMSELARAVQKASPNTGVLETIRETCSSVGKDEISASSLADFVQDISTLLDATPGDITEFILVQVLFGGGAHNVKQSIVKEGLGGETLQKSLLNDKRMKGLFRLFDKDADSAVDFKEVAIGLYPLTNSMEESAKNAAGLLLMMQKDDDRVLGYEQFAKLMLGVAAASGMTFDAFAEKLTFALENRVDSISDEVMEDILVAEEAYAEALEKIQAADERKKALDALSYSRTKRLFELWDANGDGAIDFQELLHGLRKYQKSAMTGTNIADIERDALLFMGHDKDSNQKLDPEEFALGLVKYAEAVKSNLHELIDFCVVVSSQSDTREYEDSYEAATKVSKNTHRFNQSLGTILDFEEDGDDGW